MPGSSRSQRPKGLGRWQRLASFGAPPQRPLWASGRRLSDTMYVTELVAPDTVDTMPGATLAAFPDHGDIAAQPHPDTHWR